MKTKAPWAPLLSGKTPELARPVLCEVQGRMPDWLIGDLYRNGPGQFDVQVNSNKVATSFHWFDAISMVHKFEIRNGEVSYRNRYIADGFETWIKQHGSFPAAQTFAGDPCQRIWGAFMSKFWPGGTNHPANIGVTFSRLSGAKKLVSKTDANALLEIDPVTLDPLPPTFRYTDLVPAARGPLSAAHGHYDPERATFYNYTLDIRGPMSMYHVAAMPDAGGNGHVVASVRAAPAYVHSFAATKDYIILMIFPAVLNSLKMAVFQSHMKALQWEPQRGTMFHVISKDARNGQAVATYRSDAFFCFHQLNAYQTGDDIVIDLIAYDDTRFLDAARLPALREPTGFGNVRAQVRRYTLRNVPTSLSSSSTRSSTSGLQAAVEVKNLCQQQPMYELPSINPKNLMKPYRYAYAICHTMEDVKFPDSLAKIDVQSGAAAVWSEEDCYPGEPIFVATPGSNKDEDDGVLLSVVGSISRGRSFLLVLDAKTMNEIARAWAPQLVSYGFHGRYEHRQ